MTRPGAPLEVLLKRAVHDASTAANTDSSELVFAAAIRVMAEHGTRAATMDHIASESGVSRATLFRRYGSKDALLQQALTHDLRRFLTGIEQRLDQLPAAPDRITEAFLACLQLSNHPLLRNADTNGRAEFGRAITAGDPSPLELGHRFVTARLAAAQESGELPAGDPPMQADILIRVVLGYLLVPGGPIDLSDETTARTIAQTILASIVT